MSGRGGRGRGRGRGGRGRGGGGASSGGGGDPQLSSAFAQAASGGRGSGDASASSSSSLVPRPVAVPKTYPDVEWHELAEEPTPPAAPVTAAGALAFSGPMSRFVCAMDPFGTLQSAADAAASSSSSKRRSSTTSTTSSSGSTSTTTSSSSSSSASSASSHAPGTVLPKMPVGPNEDKCDRFVDYEADKLYSKMRQSCWYYMGHGELPGLCMSADVFPPELLASGSAPERSDAKKHVDQIAKQEAEQKAKKTTGAAKKKDKKKGEGEKAAANSDDSDADPNPADAEKDEDDYVTDWKNLEDNGDDDAMDNMGGGDDD
ncbi:hypothetical protein Pelo_16565 [Pelomyxa schiedti]|nr:hypothetical protein Pelo_16565 [Pelomyxa schiedti]